MITGGTQLKAKTIRDLLDESQKALNKSKHQYISNSQCNFVRNRKLQQRSKIHYKAFEFLFHDFTTRTMNNNIKLFKGYRLFAVDGSDIQIASNPLDYDSHVQGKEGVKPYNLLHLDAMYDLLSNTYVDALVLYVIINIFSFFSSL